MIKNGVSTVFSLQCLLKWMLCRPRMTGAVKGDSEGYKQANRVTPSRVTLSSGVSDIKYENIPIAQDTT